MKYCSQCGEQLVDAAVVCTKCGCAVSTQSENMASGLKTAAKICMIIGVALSTVFIYPLIWSIPITVIYFKKMNEHQPISTGFKICCLLLVSPIAGAIMLCDKDLA